MPASPKKPRQWLLTVVSAGALLPSCADEPDFADDEASGTGEHGGPMIGVVLAPDAGQPVPDAGHVLGVVVQPNGPLTGAILAPDSGHPGNPVGTVLVPDAGLPIPGIVALPDAGVSDAGPKDAGAKDAGPKDAGAKDAACPVLINGIVILPPDASCMPFYPGIMPRNDPGSD